MRYKHEFNAIFAVAAILTAMWLGVQMRGSGISKANRVVQQSAQPRQVPQSGGALTPDEQKKYDYYSARSYKMGQEYLESIGKSRGTR